MVTHIPKQHWNSRVDGELTLTAVKALHQPPSRWQIVAQEFAATNAIVGSARAGRCYVTEGVARYSFADYEVVLAEGEFADLPEGRYTVTAGPTTARVIRVWPV